MIAFPYEAGALLLALIVILAIAFWSVKRRPRFDLDDDGADADVLPSIVAITHSALADGNCIAIIENGRY
jgi:hypothetical protein